MSAAVASPAPLEKKPVKFSNLLLGAGLNMFEGLSILRTVAMNAADFGL